MSLESELVTRLKADGTIAGLVVARIYPKQVPQAPTYPAITFRRVSGVRLHHLGGVSGRATPRISIISLTNTSYADCQTLAAAVRASLDGFNGLLTTIKASIRIENELDLSEEEVEVHGILQDYFISHVET